MRFDYFSLSAQTKTSNNVEESVDFGSISVDRKCCTEYRIVLGTGTTHREQYDVNILLHIPIGTNRPSMYRPDLRLGVPTGFCLTVAVGGFGHFRAQRQLGYGVYLDCTINISDCSHHG